MATLETMPRRPHRAALVRFPPDLYAWLAAEAEHEHRTVSAQVIHLVALARDAQAPPASSTAAPEQRDDRPPG